MKKMLMLVLAVIMIMSMAVPAFAATPSASAKPADLMPVLAEKESAVVELHTPAEAAKLSEEAKDAMAEAKKTLKDACPEGFAVKYFFYVQIIGTEKSVSVDFEAVKGLAFDAEDAANGRLAFKQFVDGKWTEELAFDVNENGTITVHGVVEGPMAVFTK